VKRSIFSLMLFLTMGVSSLFAQTTWTTNGVYSGKQSLSATAGFQFNNDNTDFDSQGGAYPRTRLREGGSAAVKIIRTKNWWYATPVK
jgi:hypothetical protein